MTDSKDIAFYYPGPMWLDGDWIKNLLLFFDGIGLLLPTYMGSLPERMDPALVAGLHEHGLLHIIEPEMSVDAKATAELAKAVASVLASGRLDVLRDRSERFHEISMSRLGYLGDRVLFDEIVASLRARGLAGDSSEAGGALGATIVNAMWQHGLSNACVISTDATSGLVQPEKSKKRAAAVLQEGALLHGRRRLRIGTLCVHREAYSRLREEIVRWLSRLSAERREQRLRHPRAGAAN